MNIQALLTDYLRTGAWDEMLGEHSVRAPYMKLMNALGQLSVDNLQKNMFMQAIFS